MNSNLTILIMHTKVWHVPMDPVRFSSGGHFFHQQFFRVLDLFIHQHIHANPVCVCVWISICQFFSMFNLSLSCSQEMKQQYEIQRLSLEEQRSRMQQQLDTFREELTAKLNIANQEVRKHTILYSEHGVL